MTRFQLLKWELDALEDKNELYINKSNNSIDAYYQELNIDGRQSGGKLVKSLLYK